jgi:hypothetical protein
MSYELPRAGTHSGQGPQTAPPGLFEVGDHVIVKIGSRFYDPSYGTDFDSIVEWARGSLAGWATISGRGWDRKKSECLRGGVCTIEAWPIGP